MTTGQFTTSQLRNLSVDDLRRHLGGRGRHHKGGNVSRRLAHNTWVEMDDDGSIGVRFHTTRILTFHPDDSFTINSGGFNTVTTKQRINALIPPGYRVYSKNFAWFIDTPGGSFPFSDGDRWWSNREAMYAEAIEAMTEPVPAMDWDQADELIAEGDELEAEVLGLLGLTAADLFA